MSLSMRLCQCDQSIWSESATFPYPKLRKEHMENPRQKISIMPSLNVGQGSRMQLVADLAS